MKSSDPFKGFLGVDGAVMLVLILFITANDLGTEKALYTVTDHPEEGEIRKCRAHQTTAEKRDSPSQNLFKYQNSLPHF